MTKKNNKIIQNQSKNTEKTIKMKPKKNQMEKIKRIESENFIEKSKKNLKKRKIYN